MIKTKDNSYTLYSEKYQETYHSTSGALEEAFLKYVEPCKIAELAKKEKISILDICFGLGYNSIAAIATADKINPDCKVEIVALDKEIPNEIKEINLGKLEPYYEELKKQLPNQQINIKNWTINMIIGDATKTIKEIHNEFDAVFLDPFSPPKNPELWTYEFFKDIRKLMKKEAILATYSCARVVRENLKKAGFIVKDGTVVGRRAPSTIAFI